MLPKPLEPHSAGAGMGFELKALSVPLTRSGAVWLPEPHCEPALVPTLVLAYRLPTRPSQGKGGSSGG